MNQRNNPNYIGIIKFPVLSDGGSNGLNYDTIPSGTENSILLYRMNSNESGTALPELTSTVTRKDGVALIIEWIKGMKKSAQIGLRLTSNSRISHR